MASEFVDALVARELTGSTPVLRLFGGPRVVCGHERFEVPEGSKRLLVFLALHRRQVERSYAAGMLWPAGNDGRAAGNLRSALWRLNQARGGLISAGKHRLSFRDDVLIDMDVVAGWARRLIAGRPVGADLAVLPAGAEAFDLLPGWYDDWVLMERERIRQRVLHALEAMSRQLVMAGRCAEGVEVALVATGAEPLRESAQRALLEAHLAEGNWVEGRRGLDAYQELLARELGIKPDPRLAAMLSTYPRSYPVDGVDDRPGAEHRSGGDNRRPERPAAESMATM